jgi:AcrR family transcriptional regulator
MSDERRAALLAAAAEVFARYGYRKASMDDVARAAGLSRQGLYLHYPTKDALFKAAVDPPRSRRAAPPPAPPSRATDMTGKPRTSRTRLLAAFIADARPRDRPARRGAHARAAGDHAADRRPLFTEMEAGFVADLARTLRSAGVAADVEARRRVGEETSPSCSTRPRTGSSTASPPRRKYREHMQVAVKPRLPRRPITVKQPAPTAARPRQGGQATARAAPVPPNERTAPSSLLAASRAASHRRPETRSGPDPVNLVLARSCVCPGFVAPWPGSRCVGASLPGARPRRRPAVVGVLRRPRPRRRRPSSIAEAQRSPRARAASPASPPAGPRRRRRRRPRPPARVRPTSPTCWRPARRCASQLALAQRDQRRGHARPARRDRGAARGRRASQPVARRAKLEDPRMHAGLRRARDPARCPPTRRCTASPGSSSARCNVPFLHDCGLTGAGVVIGVQDSGFLLDHQAPARPST